MRPTDDALQNISRARQQHHDVWWALREQALALDDADAADRAAAHALAQRLQGGVERARVATAALSPARRPA